MKKKSRVYYFAGKRKVRKDAGFKDISEIQTQEMAIQEVNYKMGSISGFYYFGGDKKRSVYGYNPEEEEGGGKEAKHRFFVNVARVIKIMQLERKACEEKLTDNEKLQLIKLEREFDYYSVVLTLDRQAKERAEFFREQAKDEEPLTETSDPYSVQVRPEDFKGRIQTGGKSEGEESRLKAILIKHKKAIGWTEREYKQKVKLVAVKRGGARTAALSKKRKAAGKKGIGGRKKGTKFNVKLGRYVSAKERGKNE